VLGVIGSGLNVRKVVTLPVVPAVRENCRLPVSMVNRQPSCVFHAIAPYDPKQPQRVDLQNNNVISFGDVVIDYVRERDSILTKQKAEDSPIRGDSSIVLEIPFQKMVLRACNKTCFTGTSRRQHPGEDVRI
jgi:hypothetical protein